MLGVLYHPQKIGRQMLDIMESLGYILTPVDYGTKYSNETNMDRMYMYNPILANLLDSVESADLCRGQFGEQGVYKEFMMCDCMIYLEDEILSFAFLRAEGDVWEVLMICARDDSTRSGSLLMRHLKALTPLLGFIGIILDSIPSAVGFYERQGFTKNFTNYHDMSHMTWYVGSSRGSSGGSRRSRIRFKEFGL